MTDVERVRAEIARCLQQLRAGCRDVEGALQGLQDWCAELWILTGEREDAR